MATRQVIDRRNFLKNAAAAGAAAAGCGWFSISRDEEATARAAAPPVRPPGALSESEFLARCIRCLRCGDACPNHAIVPLDESSSGAAQSTPVIQPRRQACMLCNKMDGDFLRCTEVCPTGALQPIRKDAAEIQAKVRMGKAEIDLALCYSYNNWSCGACFRACPFPGKAMTLGLWERPEIHAEACVGCGSCERACIRYPQAVRVRTDGRGGTETR